MAVAGLKGKRNEVGEPKILKVSFARSVVLLALVGMALSVAGCHSGSTDVPVNRAGGSAETHERHATGIESHVADY